MITILPAIKWTPPGYPQHPDPAVLEEIQELSAKPDAHIDIHDDCAGYGEIMGLCYAIRERDHYWVVYVGRHHVNENAFSSSGRLYITFPAKMKN